jgi:phage terminase large subunit
VSVQIPECFEFLFEPARYHVIHGGRGSGKSVNVAKALLIRGAQQKHRILCCRELQGSIRDSVHKLLCDEIESMGMSDFYEIQNATITGRNGTEFIFKGLRHSVSEVKSTQGITVCWVEEAQVVSKSSWEVLLPTIREDGSEFYITFNPVLEEDETYKRFVVKPPPGSLVRQVNYDQNPFFPQVLRDEMEHLRAVDEDAFLNIWMGKCRHTLDGAVFAKEMREAELGDRICSVPWNQAKPVDTFWDLGKRDMTSIWFAQVIGFEYRVLDFYENAGQNLAHYIKVLQEKPYTYGTTWLPHDAEHDLLASERTIAQQMRAAGHKVRIVPKVTKGNQIEAARSVFGQCWFDRERTSDGLQHLRHYQYDVDPDTKLRSKDPMHDEHSHAADAFLYLGMAIREPKQGVTPVPKFTPRVLPPARAGAWMGR